MIEFLLGITLWFWPIMLIEVGLIFFLVVNEYNPGWPTALFLIAFGISDFFFGTTIFLSIWHNPWWVVGGIAAYLVFGTGYTFFKWWLFNENIKDDYIDAHERWASGEARYRKRLQTVKDSVLTKADEEHQREAKSGSIGRKKSWYIQQELADARHQRRSVTQEEIELESFWTLYDELTPEQKKDVWRAGYEYKTHWDGKIPPEARNHKVRIINWLVYWPFSLVWTLLDDIVKKFATAIFNRIRGVYERISERVFSNVDF